MLRLRVPILTHRVRDQFKILVAMPNDALTACFGVVFIMNGSKIYILYFPLMPAHKTFFYDGIISGGTTLQFEKGLCEKSDFVPFHLL